MSPKATFLLLKLALPHRHHTLQRRKLRLRTHHVPVAKSGKRDGIGDEPEWSESFGIFQVTG